MNLAHLPVDIAGEITIAIGVIKTNQFVDKKIKRYKGKNKRKRSRNFTTRVAAKSLADTGIILGVTAGTAKINECIDDAMLKKHHNHHNVSEDLDSSAAGKELRKALR